MLVGDHLLLRDFGPYGIILMNVFVITTVAMVMLLRDFGSFGIICVFANLDFPAILHNILIAM
jgi:hypothetical protein